MEALGRSGPAGGSVAGRTSLFQHSLVGIAMADFAFLTWGDSRPGFSQTLEIRVLGGMAFVAAHDRVFAGQRKIRLFMFGRAMAIVAVYACRLISLGLMDLAGNRDIRTRVASIAGHGFVKDFQGIAGILMGKAGRGLEVDQIMAFSAV